MTKLNTLCLYIDIVNLFPNNYLIPGSHAHMGLPPKDPLALVISYNILSLTIIYNGPYDPYTNHPYNKMCLIALISI